MSQTDNGDGSALRREDEMHECRWNILFQMMGIVGYKQSHRSHKSFTASGAFKMLRRDAEPGTAKNAFTPSEASASG